ncbi:MAG: addiction module toxin RelE [Ignavibacteria bacterium]|jgi:plasmid stabilization system protein ParE|nr:addiction module toxin RelE [Ignavibacteria bacterium]MCU7501441.1 addiction module toxin RelE [Ignavibacteria bacterium]MCU7516043.1 addiction module toxin RelE [Ignavibacteria bacterium]
MPSWSSKDERKFQHIKDSQEKRGTKEKRAEEIAASTVNKSRRLEGRTPNKKTEGTGNPRLDLHSRTRDELYNRAKKMNIRGRSKMSKDELIKAIRSK